MLSNILKSGIDEDYLNDGGDSTQGGESVDYKKDRNADADDDEKSVISALKFPEVNEESTEQQHKYFLEDEEEEKGMVAPKALRQHAKDEVEKKSVVLTYADGDEVSVASNESNDSWNYATSLEKETLPFITLVCLPREMSKSNVSLYSLLYRSIVYLIVLPFT